MRLPRVSTSSSMGCAPKSAGSFPRSTSRRAKATGSIALLVGAHLVELLGGGQDRYKHHDFDLDNHGNDGDDDEGGNDDDNEGASDV